MNQEILQRFDVLSAKLGVVTGHMWDALVRQGYIEGARGLTAVVISLVLFYGAAQCKKSENPDTAFVGCIALVGLGIILLLIGLQFSAYLLNPEYFAVKQLLRIGQ